MSEVAWLITAQCCVCDKAIAGLFFFFQNPRFAVSEMIMV